jgi:uncharacterized protein YeaO (DUF488 family)
MRSERDRIMIKIKRIYDPPAREDGCRILIDKVWPRGMTKEKARIDFWLKDIAPTDGLRKWFGHDLNKCKEFKKKYEKELAGKKELCAQIMARAKKSEVTLLYGAREQKCNNAMVLKEYLEKTG